MNTGAFAHPVFPQARRGADSKWKNRAVSPFAVVTVTTAGPSVTLPAHRNAGKANTNGKRKSLQPSSKPTLPRAFNRLKRLAESEALLGLRRAKAKVGQTLGRVTFNLLLKISEIGYHRQKIIPIALLL